MTPPYPGYEWSLLMESLCQNAGAKLTIQFNRQYPVTVDFFNETWMGSTDDSAARAIQIWLDRLWWEKQRERDKKAPEVTP